MGLPRSTVDTRSLRWTRTDPWETGFVDIAGTGTLFGRVDGRSSALHARGWRIPFAIGALLAFVAVWLRRGLTRTTDAGAAGPVEASTPPVGMFEALRTQPAACARVVGVILVETLTFYMWLVYLPTWAQTQGGVGLSTALAVSTGSMAVFVILTPCSASSRTGWGDVRS